MYFDRYKKSLMNRGLADHAWTRIFYHLRWNVLPIAAMLILLGWLSLQAGKIIDESRQPSNPAIGFVELQWHPAKS